MQTFAWPLLMAGILDVSCYVASQIRSGQDHPCQQALDVDEDKSAQQLIIFAGQDYRLSMQQTCLHFMPAVHKQTSTVLKCASLPLTSGNLRHVIYSKGMPVRTAFCS